MKYFDRTNEYIFSAKKYLTDIFWEDEDGKQWAEQLDGMPIEIASVKCGHIVIDDKTIVVVPQWCDIKE